MKSIRDRIIRMFIMGFRQMQDPYYQGFAAQISFYLILSIVPIFILIAQILGVFNISIETAVEMLHQYTNDEVSNLMENLFRFSPLGVGNIVFLVIAIWAGSRASFALTRIANYTLTEGDSTGKNFFVERIRAVKTMFITVVTIVFSIVILCYGKAILSGVFSLIGQDPEKYTESSWMLLRWPLGFFLFFIMISYNLYILPTEKKPFRSVLPGSIFASVGMLIVTAIYSTYATSLAKYDIVYGALSSVVALLIWFFFLAWVLCLAVLFNKVWEDTSVPFSKRNPPEHLHQAKEVSKFDMDPDEFGVDVIKEILIGEQEEKPAHGPSAMESVAGAVIPKPVQDKLGIGKPKYVRQQEMKEKLRKEKDKEKEKEGDEAGDKAGAGDADKAGDGDRDRDADKAGAGKAAEAEANGGSGGENRERTEANDKDR